MNSLQLELPAHGHPLTKVEVTDSLGTVNHTMDSSHKMLVIPIPSDRSASEVGVRAWGCDRQKTPKTEAYVLKETDEPSHANKKRLPETRKHKKSDPPEPPSQDKAGREQEGGEGRKEA